MSIAFVHPFIEAMEAHGCARQDFTDWLGVPETALDDPATMIPARTIYRFLARCAEHVGDPALGARLGQHMGRGNWAPVRSLFLDSKTVSGFLVRFSQIAAEQGGAVSYRLEVEGSAALWKLSRPAPVPPEASHADATAVGFFVEVLKQATGPSWTPNDVIAVLSDASLVPPEVLPRTSTISGSSGVALRFPSYWVECRLPDVQPAPSLPSLVLPEIGVTALRDRVQQVIEHHLPDPEFGLDEVADAMGLPRWKLQSILRATGDRFAALRDQTRRMCAENLLRDTDEPISDIAAALGYSSASNFSRAFRSWSGDTPRAFRTRREDR